MAIWKRGKIWHWLRGDDRSDGEHLQDTVDRTTQPHDAITQEKVRQAATPAVHAALIYLDQEEIRHCVKAPDGVRVVAVFADASRRAIGLVLEGDIFPVVPDHGVPTQMHAETAIEGDDETVGITISFPWLEYAIVDLPPGPEHWRP